MLTEQKSRFKALEIENTPEAAIPTLKEAQKKYGFAANLFGLMSNHSGLLKAYWEGVKILTKTSVLHAEEREIAFLSTSYTNSCNYCMSAHSTVAQMMHIDQSIIDALRNGNPLPDQKLEALNLFVKAMTEKRGQVTEQEIEAFIDAGYSNEAVYEIVLIVSLKAMTNYADIIGKAPIDAPFQPNIWNG